MNDYLKGFNVSVAVDGTVLGATQDSSLSLDTDMTEFAGNNSGCRESVPGKLAWKVSIKGLVASSTAAADRLNKLTDGDAVHVKFSIGTLEVEGMCLVTSLRNDHQLGHVAKTSMTLEGASALKPTGKTGTYWLPVDACPIDYTRYYNVPASGGSVLPEVIPSRGGQPVATQTWERWIFGEVVESGVDNSVMDGISFTYRLIEADDGVTMNPTTGEVLVPSMGSTLNSSTHVAAVVGVIVTRNGVSTDEFSIQVTQDSNTVVSETSFASVPPQQRHVKVGPQAGAFEVTLNEGGTETLYTSGYTYRTYNQWAAVDTTADWAGVSLLSRIDGRATYKVEYEAVTEDADRTCTITFGETMETTTYDIQLTQLGHSVTVPLYLFLDLASTVYVKYSVEGSEPVRVKVADAASYTSVEVEAELHISMLSENPMIEILGIDVQNSPEVGDVPFVTLWNGSEMLFRDTMTMQPSRFNVGRKMPMSDFQAGNVYINVEV